MIEKVKSAMVGLGSAWVLILMLVLSVVSLAIMLERGWFYWTTKDDIGALIKDLAKFLRDGDYAGAKKRLEGSPSAEAAVVAAGLVEVEHGADAVEEAMMGASELQKIRLESRLAFLGTVGNNAPFVGLLGTVIGIMMAFDELSKAKAGAGSGAQLAPEGVMGSISEALVATAVGLLVAIPAVASYNTFQRLVKGKLANTAALGHVLLSHMRAAPEDRAPSGKSLKAEKRSED
jgi:biopolymer transport protein ExbB